MPSHAVPRRPGRSLAATVRPPAQRRRHGGGGSGASLGLAGQAAARALPAPEHAALAPAVRLAATAAHCDAGQKKEMVYLVQTTKKGTQYVEGALSNEWGANIVVLR